MLTALIVRSLRKTIHVRIANKVNHQNLAGMVLTGMFVTFYIVGCDVMALYYAYFGDNELGSLHQLKRSLNFISTGVLLLYDGAVCMIPVSLLFYVCCRHMYSNSHSPSVNQNRWNRCLGRCLSCWFHRVLYPTSFTVIFGSLKHKDLWVNEDKKWVNFRLVWIMTLSLVAPFFAISSHVTFILISWLTDTSKASSVALICLAVLIYLFFMFRQCYMANAKVEPEKCCFSRCSACWSCCLPLYPFLQCLKLVCACPYLTCCRACREISDRVEGDETPLTDLMDFKNERFDNHGNDNGDANGDNADTFNTKAFCVVYSWGWVLVASVMLVITAFAELPIVTFDLLSDLLNTFQVFIILISLLITYKILSINEPDVYRFLHNLRDTYRTQSRRSGGRVNGDIQDLRQVDDVEAAGCIMGELAEVLIHKFPQENTAAITRAAHASPA